MAKALKAVKKNKTSGSNGIENKTLKCLETLTPPLTNIFNRIIEERYVPEQWCISEIIFLFIKDRLYKTLDYQQPPEQASFRKEFAPTDHIHTLNQLIERANEYNLDLRILFINFAKAFDLMYHQEIWETLASQGIPSTAIEILTYMNTRRWI